MDGLWTWTRPSTNITTSAHTPAPCWTLSSDQSITLPKTDPYAVHSGNVEDFQYIYKSFDQWGDVLDWNVNKKNPTGPGIKVQLEP